MFNILKSLFNDAKLKNYYNEKNTKQIDDAIHKSEKCKAPVVNTIVKKEFNKDLKLSSSSDNIDIFKAKQYSPLNDESTTYTKFSAADQELFNLMKDQLREKDLQIRNLSEILNQEQALHKNTQILFKQEQSKQNSVPPKNDLDQRLTKIETNISKRKEQKHKGFFGA